WSSSVCHALRTPTSVAPLSVLMPRRPPTSTLFPYTTLFRSVTNRVEDITTIVLRGHEAKPNRHLAFRRSDGARLLISTGTTAGQDRKSTRLNSSHVKISYAVFCLKKKTHTDGRVGTDDAGGG